MAKALLFLVVVMVCGAVTFRFLRGTPAPPAVPVASTPAESPAPVSPIVEAAEPVPSPAAPAVADPVESAETQPGGAETVTTSDAPRPPVPPWIERLLAATPGKGLTAEQAAEIKAGLADLRADGAAAVPAVKAFLERNRDVSFTGSAVRGQVGNETLRGALFDALRQIDGPEAREALAWALRDTGDPREVRQLARHLDEMAPGEYREDILAAARETLELVKREAVIEGEVGPVFDLLRQHGDASVVADLESLRATWSHYSAMALAGLPGGEGIPSLLGVAGTTEARKPAEYFMAFQLLAQVADRQASAGAGLMAMAREGQIPAEAWSHVTRGLLDAGSYTYGRLNSVPVGSKTRRGEQPFYGLPLTATADGDLIHARVGFIDRMLQVTTDPVGIDALRQARGELARKLGVP